MCTYSLHSNNHLKKKTMSAIPTYDSSYLFCCSFTSFTKTVTHKVLHFSQNILFDLLNHTVIVHSKNVK